jgi:hypothetical protein
MQMAFLSFLFFTTRIAGRRGATNLKRVTSHQSPGLFGNVMNVRSFAKRLHLVYPKGRHATRFVVRDREFGEKHSSKKPMS